MANIILWDKDFDLWDAVPNLWDTKFDIWDNDPDLWDTTSFLWDKRKNRAI